MYFGLLREYHWEVPLFFSVLPTGDYPSLGSACPVKQAKDAAVPRQTAADDPHVYLFAVPLSCRVSERRTRLIPVRGPKMACSPLALKTLSTWGSRMSWNSSRGCAYHGFTLSVSSSNRNKGNNECKSFTGNDLGVTIYGFTTGTNRPQMRYISVTQCIRGRA